MILRPVRLEPRFVPRLWGVRSLAPLFPEKQSLPEPVGEVWLTGTECRFAEGPLAGETLGESWPRMGDPWAGRGFRRARPFPLLVYFIFPGEILSVQVHPPDDYAREHEALAGGIGKTEMWYVIAALEGAAVRVGLKPGVTREQFRRAIAEGTAEECVERLPVAAGDAVFVPAGTVHTIGPGMILCEVQQNSDVTYRVFDYHRLTAEGRPRDLHVDKAMNVIRFGDETAGKARPVATREGERLVTHYVACPYFAVEKWSFEKPVSATTSGDHFDVLIFLEGHGRILAGGEGFAYAPAQPWFLPARLGEYHFSPETNTAVLRAYVPGSLADYKHRLIDRGASERDAARVVFP